MIPTYAEYERVWPWLAASIAHYAKTHSKEDLWAMIERREAQLHPLPHAAMVTTMTTYPTGFKEGAIWLGGGELQEIKRTLPHTETWLAREGCDISIIRGRLGWARVFPDYRMEGVILIKELKK